MVYFSDPALGVANNNITIYNTTLKVLSDTSAANISVYSFVPGTYSRADIYSMCGCSNDMFLIIGDFNKIGDENFDGIAFWNGSQWETGTHLNLFHFYYLI